MSVLTFTNESFQQNVLNRPTKVLVDFFATWCGPCKILAGTVERVAEEHPDCIIGKVDIDKNPELAQKYNVMSVPTLILFDRGVEIKRSSGAIPKEAVAEMLL